jgi:alpha-tubulin suppressor-like RCC1 family protein
MGDGNGGSSDTPVRVHLPKGTRVTAISAGEDFGLARTAKGQALAWGLNNSGQLGNGSTADNNTPVRVKLPKGTKVKALAGGGAHSLALSTAGQLYAWGDNTDGTAR